MARTVAASVSDRAAGMVLILTGILFFTVLTFGWYRLFLRSLSAGVGKTTAIACAIFIAGLAVALARAAAAERVRLQGVQSKALWTQDRTWIGYFALLLCISALGTLSTVLFFGEGNQILLDKIDGVQQCATTLEAATPSLLATPEFDAKKAKVTALRIKLEREIRNERNCGDGPVAGRIFEELRQELPAVQRLSGRNARCEGLDALIGEYAQNINDQLRQTEEFRSDRVAEKEAFREQLTSAVKKSRADLQSARDVSNASAFGFDKAKATVEETITGINRYAERAQSFSAQPIELQCSVAMEDIRELGEFWQTVPLLVHLLDHPSTHAYFASAIGVDWMMISFFARVLRGARDRTGRRSDPSDPREGTDGPENLWVDPRQ